MEVSNSLYIVTVRVMLWSQHTVFQTLVQFTDTVGPGKSIPEVQLLGQFHPQGLRWDAGMSPAQTAMDTHSCTDLDC